MATVSSISKSMTGRPTSTSYIPDDLGSDLQKWEKISLTGFGKARIFLRGCHSVSMPNSLRPGSPSPSFFDGDSLRAGCASEAREERVETYMITLTACIVELSLVINTSLYNDNYISGNSAEQFTDVLKRYQSVHMYV
ncbi:hypothetical protein CROQUDRAFT_97089 [Cronartium quercuum f. sp. fusiforme G11]|uniref:Uncharacterized protein n=1 Tax=Cronartium quercuum f. sp. fusiforme G11 TaxID=708437 RepID=A0A9P6NAW6_9BASI|nr:hypothetical protein CROQUDRAFT_97089 [Cronartium quercuum f. sp. fusiforme G11]